MAVLKHGGTVQTHKLRDDPCRLVLQETTMLLGLQPIQNIPLSDEQIAGESVITRGDTRHAAHACPHARSIDRTCTDEGANATANTPTSNEVVTIPHKTTMEAATLPRLVTGVMSATDRDAPHHSQQRAQSNQTKKQTKKQQKKTGIVERKQCGTVLILQQPHRHSRQWRWWPP
jgi:hypothetical protein